MENQNSTDALINLFYAVTLSDSENVVSVVTDTYYKKTLVGRPTFYAGFTYTAFSSQETFTALNKKLPFRLIKEGSGKINLEPLSLSDLTEKERAHRKAHNRLLEVYAQHSLTPDAPWEHIANSQQPAHIRSDLAQALLTLEQASPQSLTPSRTNSFCSFPWTGVQIHVSGQVRPCCMIDDLGISYQNKTSIRDSLKTPRLDQVKQTLLAGGKPHECRACYEEDRLGVTSVRLMSPPLSTTPDKDPIFRAEVSLTNTCNLDCVMCRPDFSGKVARNEEQFHMARGRPDLVRSFHPFTIPEEDVAELVEQFRNADECRLIGGEPLLTKAGRRWIKLWADQEIPGRLEIITNGTQLDEDMLRDMTRVKNLTLLVSVDGYGKTYEWIRGHSWEDMSQKIIRASQSVPIRLIPTIQAYNLFNLPELSEFCRAQKIRLRIGHLLRHPHHLSALLWPLNMRRTFAAQVKNLWGEDHDDLYEFLIREAPERPDSLPLFREWTTFINKKRGFDWHTIDPLHESIFNGDIFSNGPF